MLPMRNKSYQVRWHSYGGSGKWFFSVPIVIRYMMQSHNAACNVPP